MDKNSRFGHTFSRFLLGGESEVFNGKLIFAVLMEKKNEIVLSGIRPTGFVHLGNYFGAIRNWVKMQDEYECFFCVVDWHSLTTHPDTRELKANVMRLLAELLASGLDPDKCVLYVQSDIPEIAELYLYLNMMAYKGELEKTVTFKDKVRLQPENVNAGLLTYPVLQSADILVHRAVKVPVGKDQEQHIEMTRNFAERFNHRYGPVFPSPYAFTYGGGELLKIMSLDGKGKMSKSENQMNTLYLSDEDDLIQKKIMKARTDEGPSHPHADKPDFIEGLFTLMQVVSTEDTLNEFETDYNTCRIRYGDFKKKLAEDMVKFIRPIRDRINTIRTDEKRLNQVMEQGAVNARTSAKATLRLVKQAMGLNYF
jgi:tryptophanyl-tRNA synthetase